MVVPPRPIASPQTSNLPRQSTIPASQAASGPPPLQQAPAPGPALSTAARQNVNITNISNMIPPGSRSRTPTEGRRIHTGSDHSRGLSYDDRPELNDATRNAGMRSISAASNNRSALPQQVQYGNIHTEDESSGPANGLGKSLSQIRTSRQGQYTNNGDDSTDTLAAQNGTFLARDTMVFDDADAPHMKSGKEIDDLKKSNASLLAELAAARKAGYITGAYQDSSLDGNTSSIGEQHQRIPEQISRIRNAFSDGSNDIPKKMQKLVQHIAELERQRDAAVKDAANANARLSASADSPSGSPSLGSREIDHHHDHSNAVSRKLATTIAAHKALQSKLSAVEADHASEKQARELAESNVEAAHRRALHFDEVHDPGELETLRSDLHQAQTEARANAILLNELQSHSQIVDIEHEDLKRQHSEHVSSSTDHVAFIGSLRSAVSASEEKFTLLERKLIEEREAKESLQSKLAQLRTEHEDRTAELDSTSKKLRDSEELAEKHANEATKHRQVLLAGLDRLGTRPTENAAAGTHEKKLVVLQQQIKDSNALVVKSKTDAERASDKLRSAEERIAGLEAYQLQSSREALTLRKQLQDAIRTAQQYQSQHTEVRSKLEANQRAVSVLGIQHGALRNIMEQRSDSATRSLESPGPGLGIDNLRLQELEQLLNDSYRAHEETKSSFESSQQVSEKAYREKLEQLEQDYQSAVSYVKGTEKMLKRMKDELTKSKSQNVRLQSELEASRSGSTIPAPVGWESEREAMQQEIDKMQGSVKAAIAQLETQVADVQKELHTVQNERDQFRVRNDQLNMAVEQTHVELQTHKRDNAALEVRATDAESKITLLLDQMEHSVDHYRRQSQMQQTQPNGVADHTRDISVSTYGGGHSHSNSIGGESFSTSGLDRNSMALDNLASELETLRTQWEGTHKTYRLSNNFDFDRRPSETNGGGGGNVGAGSGGGGGGELSSSLASWRKRLEAEERDKDRISDPTPAALRTGPSRQES